MKIKKVVFGADSRSAVAIPGVGRHLSLHVGKLTNEDANNPLCEIVLLDLDARSGLLTIRKRPVGDSKTGAARMWNSGAHEEQQCEADFCSIAIQPSWIFYGDNEAGTKCINPAQTNGKGE